MLIKVGNSSLNTQTAGLETYNIEYFIFTAIYAVMLLVGAVSFIRWLTRTKMGATSLLGVSPKNHYMDVSVVMGVFGIWIFSQFLINIFLMGMFFDSVSQYSEIVSHIAAVLSSLVTTIAISIVATKYFQGALKGFGLDMRTLWTDIRFGLVNYLSILPVVFSLTMLVAFIARLIVGEDFQMPNHSLIKALDNGTPIWFSICAIILATVAAPIVEEFLFRGILQNYIFSLTNKPWLSIFITSVLFAMVHGFSLKYHWLALFALSCCMGYAYIKSGSLLRSIVVHATFNLVSVVSALITIHFGQGL